jgi:hypothetical protein
VLVCSVSVSVRHVRIPVEHLYKSLYLPACLSVCNNSRTIIWTLIKSNIRGNSHLWRDYVLTNHLNEYRMLVGSIHRDAPSSLEQKNAINLT